MALAFNPWGVPPVLAGLLSLALSWTIYRARPDRAQNRWLALFMFGTGVVLTTWYGVRMFLTDPDLAYALGIAAYPFFWLFLWAYLLFVGTLETPLAKPLRTRTFRALWTLYCGVPVVLLLTFPLQLIPSLAPYASLGGWAFDRGPLRSLFALSVGPALLVGIVIGVSAWRRARTPSAERQMRAYVTAFTVYEVLVIGFVVFWLSGLGQRPALVLEALNLLWPAGQTLYLGVAVAWAILRTQVFDVEIVVKRGIRHSTVAAAFVAVFFVVSEGAQQFFAGTSLGPWLGILAAGALVFAIAPLQRLAGKVSDAAMPDVDESDEYLTFRKHEVFRHAVEEAVVDGVISDKERRVLDEVKEGLGIGEDVADRLERDALGATRGGA